MSGQYGGGDLSTRLWSPWVSLGTAGDARARRAGRRAGRSRAAGGAGNISFVFFAGRGFGRCGGIASPLPPPLPY